MLRCTIRISSHDLTHHSVIPYRNNHATSPDVATPQLTSLSMINYTATISPLPPRLPTSPPFRNTIPSTPSIYFLSTFVPSYAVTIRAAHLQLNEGKCVFGATETSYVGFKVNSSGIYTEDRKIAAINDWSVLASTAQLRSF